MDRVVVDACVAIKWFVSEVNSPLALSALAGRTNLHAPDLMLAEVANGLWKNVRLGRLRQDLAPEAIERIPSYFGSLVPFEKLRREAFELALSLDHSVYDCAYLAAARHFSCPLLTTDEKLAKKATAAGLETPIVLLRNWSP